MPATNGSHIYVDTVLINCNQEQDAHVLSTTLDYTNICLLCVFATNQCRGFVVPGSVCRKTPASEGGAEAKIQTTRILKFDVFHAFLFLALYNSYYLFIFYLDSIPNALANDGHVKPSSPLANCFQRILRRVLLIFSFSFDRTSNKCPIMATSSNVEAADALT